MTLSSLYKILTAKSIVTSGLFGSMVLRSMFQVQSADYKNTEIQNKQHIDSKFSQMINSLLTVWILNYESLSLYSSVAKLVEKWVLNAPIKSDCKACQDRLAGQQPMMVAETQQFVLGNGHSVQPNNTCMLCNCISDKGLYSFCYWQIGVCSFSSFIFF